MVAVFSPATLYSHSWRIDNPLHSGL